MTHLAAWLDAYTNVIDLLPPFPVCFVAHATRIGMLCNIMTLMQHYDTHSVLHYAVCQTAVAAEYIYIPCSSLLGTST